MRVESSSEQPTQSHDHAPLSGYVELVVDLHGSRDTVRPSNGWVGQLVMGEVVSHDQSRGIVHVDPEVHNLIDRDGNEVPVPQPTTVVIIAENATLLPTTED